MKQKDVACPGKVLNNTSAKIPRHSNSWIEDKLKFLSNYKFTIAMENESAYNYITEKIFHSFLAGSIPIYWGAPNINDFFNPKSFINISDFNTFDDAIEYVKEVDNNDALYTSYLSEFPIHSKSKLNNITEENIIQFFRKIIKCT